MVLSLLPCPFCGTGKYIWLEKLPVYLADEIVEFPGKFRFVCNAKFRGCGFTGESCKTEEEAAESWNAQTQEYRKNKEESEVGMNYYAVEKSYRYGRDEIHIGKSSFGWLFCFQSCEYFRTFPQFEAWLRENVDSGKYQIYDEEGNKISPKKLLKMIEAKQNDPRDKNNLRNFEHARNVDGYRFEDVDFS